MSCFFFSDLIDTKNLVAFLLPAASGKGTGISPDDPRYWCKISWGSTGGAGADEVEIEKLWTANGSEDTKIECKNAINVNHGSYRARNKYMR